MFDIPNIPLKLPVKENIHKEPTYPYTFHTEGALLGNKFSNLMDHVVNYWFDEGELQQKLLAEFQHHKIADLFSNWSIREIGDFCRHVVLANKDELGWDRCDFIINKLNNIAIPGWKLPNFEFITYFNQILSRIVKIYFPERLINEIKQILQSNIIKEIQIDKNLKTQLHLWTVKELWLLLSYLGSRKEYNVDEGDDALRQLLNHISNTFKEMISSGNYQVHERLCLILLFIDGYAGLDKKSALESKDLVDQIWMEIEQLSYNEKLSYKYLLGAAYSIIGEKLFQQDTDFITRKLFIDSFINNYMDLEDYNLWEWFIDLISHQEINELVLDLMVRGYSKTVPLLKKHIMELPTSKTKDAITAKMKELNNLLERVILSYLKPGQDISTSTVSDILKRVDERFEFYKVKRNMYELLYAISSQAIFLSKQLVKPEQSKLYNLTYHILLKEISEERAIIYDLDYRLNSGNYDFDGLYAIMRSEVDKFHSLILSTTFEKEIVAMSSRCIQAFIDYPTDLDLFIDVYEIILQFLISWLNKLSEDVNDFREGMMILSPLIHICFIQQIRYYFENNYPKKAFLMNLNLHSFMEVYNDEVGKTKQLLNPTQATTKKRIMERYKDITKNWEAKELLSPIKIKEIIIDTRKKFKTSGLTSKGFAGSLLEDKIIHGYLDEIERLENFIGQDYKSKGDSKVDQLLRSGIRQPSDLFSINRMERLHSDLFDNSIPIPVFNNVHKLGVASELFEIRAPVDQVVEQHQQVQEQFQKAQISNK